MWCYNSTYVNTPANIKNKKNVFIVIILLMYFVTIDIIITLTSQTHTICLTHTYTHLKHQSTQSHNTTGNSLLLLGDRVDSNVILQFLSCNSVRSSLSCCCYRHVKGPQMISIASSVNQIFNELLFHQDELRFHFTFLYDPFYCITCAYFCFITNKSWCNIICGQKTIDLEESKDLKSAPPSPASTY